MTYKRKEVKEEVNEAQGLTRSGRCFALEELRKARTLRDNPVLVKKPVTEEEADEFLRKIKVLDVAVSYNLLLCRPWIHVDKAVPSSLHQMVNFEWDRQEIIVYGDENLCAFNDTSVPFIEAEEDKG
ncbi:uncharacterized protein [Nicotiana sylvestris]|uniref:uncharacterized protein n=1 Tax=Nicotiana sylvestris TaxID=4096 RepID=UPI00388C7AA6